MDIIVGQLVQKKKAQLTKLAERAIAVNLKTSRISDTDDTVQRCFTVVCNAPTNPLLHPRSCAKAGGLSTQSVTFSASNNSQKANTLLPAMRGGSSHPAMLQNLRRCCRSEPPTASH